MSELNSGDASRMGIKELEDGVVLAIEQRDAAEAKLAMVKAAIERFRTSSDGGPTAWETVTTIEGIVVEELERTDPKVSEAKHKYDDMVDRWKFRRECGLSPIPEKTEVDNG